MPKRILDLRDFSGGINSRINKTEINDNEVAKSVGVMYDVPGIIRGMGATTALKYDGTNVITTVSDSTYLVGAKNGYGLGFVSFDFPSQIIILKTSNAVSSISAGEHLSNSNTTGDWHTMTTGKFVVKAYRLDNASTPKLIYCYVIRPGSGAAGLFGNEGIINNIAATTIQLYKSSSYTGTSPSSSVILAVSGFANYISDDDSSFDFSENLNWVIDNAYSAQGLANQWEITNSDTLVLTSTPSATPQWVQLTVFDDPIVANAFYLLKITFSTDLSGGDLVGNLNGRTFILDNSEVGDITSNILYKIVKAGNASNQGLIILSATAGLSCIITDITLIEASYNFGNTDDTLSDILSESALVYVNSPSDGANKVKYFSYENEAFIEFMVDSTTVENEKAVLTLKDDDNATTYEISPIIYSIEGAIKLVDANHKKVKADFSASRGPFQSTYIKHIDRKYFNDRNSYFEWIAEPSDIDKPTNGIIKSDGNPLLATQMTNGFVNMLLYRHKPQHNSVVFKEFVDCDGLYSGYKHNHLSKWMFPINATKWNTISAGTAPIPTLPDGTAPTGCVGWFKRDSNSRHCSIQYHAGVDGTTSQFECFDKVIDMSSSNAGAITFTIFISEEAYVELAEEDGLGIYIGNAGDYPEELGASFGETWDGSWRENIAMAEYLFTKNEITPGWTTYRLEAGKHHTIHGAYDPKFIKDFSIALRSRNHSNGGTYAFDQISTNSSVGQAGSALEPSVTHEYIFYFVGSDHTVAAPVDYDGNSYITLKVDVGGSSTNNPKIAKIMVKYADFFTIDAVSFPDGSFDGEGNNYHYRNRAVLTMKDKADAAIVISDYFVVGDLVMIRKDGADSDTTSTSNFYENQFFASVREISDFDNTITITLPTNDNNIMGSQIGDPTEDSIGFSKSEFDADSRLYRSPNEAESGGVQGPIVFHQNNDYSTDVPSDNKTGVGANFTHIPVPFAVSNISYEKALKGEWNGKYSFYYTFIYDDNQESKMFEFKGLANSFGTTTNTKNELELSEELIYLTFCLNEATITGGWNHATAGRRRINKANIYYSKILEEAESGDISYYFLGELDLNEGFRLSGSTKFNKFQKIAAGFIADNNVSVSASDIIFKHDTDDEIYSDSGEINFAQYFKVNDRIKVEPESVILLGSERITTAANRTFASDTGAWVNDAAASSTVGSNVLTITTSTDVEKEGAKLAVSSSTFTGIPELGKTYRVRADLDQTSGATTPRVRFGLGGAEANVKAVDGAPVDGTINDTEQEYYADLKIVDVTGDLRIFNPPYSSATVFTVDNVSVMEIIKEVTVKAITTTYGSPNDRIQVDEEIVPTGNTTVEQASFTLMGGNEEFYSVSSAADTQSIATIQSISATPTNSDIIKLTDTEGNSVTYQIVTSSTVVDGSKTGSNVTVGTSGASSVSAVAQRFVDAINSTTEYNNSLTLNITATKVLGVVTLTQDTPGRDGDTNIVSYLDTTDFIVSNKFSGNIDNPIPYSSLAPVKIEYPPQIDIFETKALYNNDVEYTAAKFKTHTINSGVLYAGNVLQGDKVYPDRILKSLPNRYDLFPSDNFIEVTVNDGDEIIVLESFNDRILQFKKGALTIINVAGSLEFLENTYEHLGVHSVTSVYKTDKGIIFANRSGIYIFIGEGEPVKLTSKLSDADWKTFVNNTPENLLLMYIPHKDQIVVGNTASEDGYIVDLRTKSISFGEDIVRVGDQYTNVVYDTTNNMPVYLQEGADDIGITSNNDLTFRTFYNDEDETYLASVTHKILEPGTSADIVSATGIGVEFKHLDFGSPDVRKKIHGISISTKDSDGNLKLQYSTDTGNSWADIAASEGDSTITDYAGNRGSFSRQRFSVSINNVYTLGLRVVPTTGSETSKTSDFAIQNISIVYRIKSAK